MENELIPGDIVEIVGLVKGAQYNGKQGEIVSDSLSFGKDNDGNNDNKKSDRLMVRVLNNGGSDDIVLKVLPSNLKKISSGSFSEVEVDKNNFSFREGMKVKIQGLVKASQFNGEEGVIMGINETGERFIVSLSGDRSVTVKPENMVLLDGSTNINQRANTKGTSSSTSTSSAYPDLNIRPEQIKNLSANEAIQKATYLKSLDSAGLERLRQMNPAMRSLTDEQIRYQATQMEMMAKNPEMFEMAKKQMEENPHLVKSAFDSIQSKSQSTQIKPSVAAPSSTPVQPGMPSLSSLTPEQIQMAQEQMKNADPETLKNQAKMFRSMIDNPAQFEAMKTVYPQFASLTPDQLRYQCSMMEMMADNPSMMQTMRDQIANNPDILKNAMGGNNGDFPIASSNASEHSNAPMPQLNQNMMNGMQGMTPSPEMFENMTPEQMSNMLKMARDMAKSDPEGFKRMTGMDAKQLEAMDSVDPESLEKAMGAMKRFMRFAKPFIKAYQSLNNATNGNARSIILGVFIIIIGLLIQYLFFSSTVANTILITETGIRDEVLTKAKDINIEANENEDEFQVNIN